MTQTAFFFKKKKNRLSFRVKNNDVIKYQYLDQITHQLRNIVLYGRILLALQNVIVDSKISITASVILADCRLWLFFSGLADLFIL
jgi:hypothetical protein